MRLAVVSIAFMMITTDVLGDSASSRVGAAARGVLKPSAEATLTVQFSAVVRKINFKEGQSFDKGATLIEFDCRKMREEHKSAVATTEETRVNHESNSYLLNRGALGKHDVAISKARLKKAEAEAEALRISLEKCEVFAPFAGSVVRLDMHEHEASIVGKPIMRIIEGGSLIIEMIVPSNWVAWLRVGQGFTFSVEETGRSYAAKVQRLSTAVDPISQTIKLFAALEGDGEVLAGMSGTGHFNRSGE